MDTYEKTSELLPLEFEVKTDSRNRTYAESGQACSSISEPHNEREECGGNVLVKKIPLHTYKQVRSEKIEKKPK